jgi:hypothetical protein
MWGYKMPLLMRVDFRLTAPCRSRPSVARLVENTTRTPTLIRVCQMGKNLKKFVNPKFVRTVDPRLLARLFERHRHEMPGFDHDALHGDPQVARERLEAFFASTEEHIPEGLMADLHRVAELGNADGLRLLLNQASRLRVVIMPERDPEGSEHRQDPKHVALRIFLDHPAVFDAASDMLALTARCSLTEFAGLAEGFEADLGDGPMSALEAAAAKMFEVDHCGCYCRVGWYEDADTVNLVLTHGSIVRTTAILQGRQERVISYRAAENAVLSYSAASGRIKIGGGTPLRRSALAELFAEKMLGQSGFFAGPDAQNLYTLAAIERVGCGFAFNHAFDPAIRRVRIVEAQADQLSHDPSTGTTRLVSASVARDDGGGALDRLAETMRSRSFGPDWKLRQIVVRVNIDAGAGRPGQVTVQISPPAKATFRRHRFEGRIMTLLQRKGLVHDRYSYGAAIAAE